MAYRVGEEWWVGDFDLAPDIRNTIYEHAFNDIREEHAATPLSKTANRQHLLLVTSKQVQSEAS